MSQEFNPKRALLSVSDKTGLIELAQALVQQEVELIATGNTRAVLIKQGIPVQEISECTGFPEMMDGRVKTLHPAIHAGILARGKQDESVLSEHGIKAIDLVIVNLYPFQQVVTKPDCEFQEAIENIDIGGPTMVRAAAKNHAHCFVVVSPEDYPVLMHCLQTKTAPAEWGFQLAKKAFAHTAAYDGAISNYLSSLGNESGFPEVFSCQFHQKTPLRYGENPHQKATFYADLIPAKGSLGYASLIQGKQLSYNNLLDADAALECVKSFPVDEALCVIVKHANPCGIALSSTPLKAYLRAFQADPQSAYGGIIAFNRTLDEPTAQAILDNQFVEVILAPDVTPAAEKVLATKENIRLLITAPWQEHKRLNLKQVDGGVLLQEQDSLSMFESKLQCVTSKQPSEQQKQDLMFAWLAAKHVKSNAIVFAKDKATIGIGGGQTSRVMSARIGLWQAQHMGFDTQGAVMASDAFIPFPDTVELAASAGVVAIIQPGGSIRDKDIIDYASKQGIIMLFTGIRHFKH